MSEFVHLQPPFAEAQLRKLRVGDQVLLSGIIYTARDAAHKRLIEAIQTGDDLPISLEGACIYYVGPSPARPGEVVGAAGPTTASRVDIYTPALLARGLKGMIGKGKRSPAVREAIRQFGAVYLVAVGGAAALIADCIKRVEVIAYPDLESEAIHRMTVVDFALIVANDAHGGDLYEMGRAAYQHAQTE